MLFVIIAVGHPVAALIAIVVAAAGGRRSAAAGNAAPVVGAIPGVAELAAGSSVTTPRPFGPPFCAQAADEQSMSIMARDRRRFINLPPSLGLKSSTVRLDPFASALSGKISRGIRNQFRVTALGRVACGRVP